MSRTFRRLNYETISNRSSDTGGCKIAGYYTENTWCHIPGAGHSLLVIYRLPTERELYEKFRDTHGDGVFNRWGIYKFDRKKEQKRYRLKENKKIKKYMTSKVEDVINDRLLKRQPWTWI